MCKVKGCSNPGVTQDLCSYHIGKAVGICECGHSVALHHPVKFVCCAGCYGAANMWCRCLSYKLKGFVIPEASSQGEKFAQYVVHMLGHPDMTDIEREKFLLSINTVCRFITSAATLGDNNDSS